MSTPPPPARAGAPEPAPGRVPGGVPDAGRPPVRLGYQPALDGLRTVAVVLVVVFHARVAGGSSGFIGLDLFFTLSGFLITSVVVAEMESAGRLRLGRFYARRVRRLLPAALVAVLVTSGVFLLVASQPERLGLVRQAQAALVYLANWQFVADDADYFAGDVRDSPFLHYWSLSVEEQFYLVFPLLLLLWWKVGGGRARTLLVWFGVLIALSVTSQLYWAQVDPTRAYFGTDARLFQLLAGAAAAVALRTYATAAPAGGVVWRRAGPVLGVVGLSGVLVLGTELVPLTVSHRNLLVTVFSCALIVGVVTGSASLVARALALPWMTYLGKISYGIYLWHYPIILVLGRVLDVPAHLIAVMAFGLSVALASASYQLLEEPVRRGRVLVPVPWASVAVGVTLSAVVAAFVVGPILTSDRRPALQAGTTPGAGILVGDGSSPLNRPVPAGLDLAEVAVDRGQEFPICTADDVEGCVAVDGDGPHVVLVGDSHARMLTDAFVALAEDEGFKLSVDVAASCPWHDGLYNTNVGPSTAEACLAARRGFYDVTLPAMEPDVVVLASFARSDPAYWESRTSRYDGGAEASLGVMYRDAVARTVTKIERAGARSVMVESMMGTAGFDREGFDPLDCLARAERQGECAVVPALLHPVVDAFYQEAATAEDSAVTIDLNPIFCPDAPLCAPVVDGAVVWRDQRHVSSAFVTEHRDLVLDALEASGVLTG